MRSADKPRPGNPGVLTIAAPPAGVTARVTRGDLPRRVRGSREVLATAAASWIRSGAAAVIRSRPQDRGRQAQADDLGAAEARAFHDLATCVGGLDDDHPPMIWVRPTGDQAKIAQRVDDARHCGWRDLFGSGQGREGARTARRRDRGAQPSGRDNPTRDRRPGWLAAGGWLRCSAPGRCVRLRLGRWRLGRVRDTSRAGPSSSLW